MFSPSSPIKEAPENTYPFVPASSMPVLSHIRVLDPKCLKIASYTIWVCLDLLRRSHLHGSSFSPPPAPSFLIRSSPQTWGITKPWTGFAEADLPRVLAGSFLCFLLWSGCDFISCLFLKSISTGGRLPFRFSSASAPICSVSGSAGGSAGLRSP